MNAVGIDVSVYTADSEPFARTLRATLPDSRAITKTVI